jgi:hypothetical protein
MIEVSTDILLFVAFIAAFVVFIASSFGIGKAEDDKDETAKDFAIRGLTGSILGMTGLWAFKNRIRTPKFDFAGQGITSQIYLFLMHLIPVGIGMGSLSASAYGLGKYDKRRQTQEYTASIAFFAIGLSISIITLGSWQAGNLASDQCTPAIEAAKKLVGKAKKSIGAEFELKQKAEMDDVDAIAADGGVDTESSEE